MGQGSKTRARARKLEKRRGLDLPKLAPTKSSRKPRDEAGRFVSTDAAAPETALQARCRHLGIHPSQDAMKAATAQHSGSELGRVMVYQVAAGKMRKSRIPALWDVWQAYLSAHRTYGMLVLGQQPYPRTAAVEMVPEPMQADPSARVDLRDEETRIRDAKAARARWDGHIARLSGADGSALAFLRTGGGPALWDGKRPTKYGLVTLAALDRLAKVVEKT